MSAAPAMVITLPEPVLEALRATGDAPTPLYGRLLDDGDVAQVAGLAPGDGALLGYAVADLAAGAPGEADGMLRLWLDPTTPEPVAVVLRGGRLLPAGCQVIRAHRDYTSRLKGLFDPGRLAERCVTLIGCGSGGSLAAAQLARCGIGHMRLVDFDRLELHNVARHACDTRDLGRYKTRALRDLLCAASPLVAVTTFEVDVLKDHGTLLAAVAGADLVVVAVDSEPAKLTINRACWERGIPAVYGAAYNRAFGGDIFRARPPDGPCYECLSAVIGELFAPPPTAADDFAVGYADPERMADLIAQPGLGMDVGVIAMLLARVALETLLGDDPAAPEPLPGDWLLFGNRAEWIFKEPLQRHFVAVPRREECPVCNYESYARATLGMSGAEAAAAARRILDDAGSAASEPG
jgi:molybdopterin/thiamine biosynthesis adenylyltransferase